MIVTIDGPAGSGKSSTAKSVATKTGWYYLDSGSLYRAYTLLYLNYGDLNEFLDSLYKHNVTLEVDHNHVQTLLDGNVLGDAIRTPNVSQNVSKISALSEVRRKVNAEMRRIVQRHDFIADGRDLGSIVFPDAVAKFFMVADIHIRAERRYQELVAKGMDVSLDEIKQNLAERDYQDSTRDEAPLIKPHNAIEIDTTKLPFEEQVEIISSVIKKLK